jgi:hypothetical protein
MPTDPRFSDALFRAHVELLVRDFSLAQQDAQTLLEAADGDYEIAADAWQAAATAGRSRLRVASILSERLVVRGFRR